LIILFQKSTVITIYTAPPGTGLILSSRVISNAGP
jgi:hypothetical protein